MLGSFRKTSSCKKSFIRPYSAATVMSHKTEYRVNDNESMNELRSSIHQMFDGEKRELKDIRSLT